MGLAHTLNPKDSDHMSTRQRHTAYVGLVVGLILATVMMASEGLRGSNTPRATDVATTPSATSSGARLLRGTLAAQLAQQSDGTVPSEDSRVTGLMARTDQAMGAVNNVIAAFFFFDVAFWSDDLQVPFIVIWLVIAAIYLTLRMGFINVRGFLHALHLVTGRFTDPSEPGDVSHFQALSTALSATVGLGNIAGVSIAISLGGPGATFWMILAGLLGMTTKFTECTLGQMFRHVGPDGHVLGGPVRYLSRGLAQKGMPGTGLVLATLFALLCIGGSLGGGNAFQVNQSLNAIQETVPWLADAPWVYGLIMTALAGVVIVGGIHRIASVADKIMPFMTAVYVLAALTVIFMNVDMVPAALSAIVTGAFAPEAAYGGFIGVLVIGFQRAAFSNEAGAGSAAIAHSAAKTAYPIRERLRGPTRTLYRHRRDLHDDRAGHQHYGGVQQSGLCRSHQRRPGGSAHLAGVQ